MAVWTRPVYPCNILPRGDTAWVWTWGTLLHLDASGKVLDSYTTVNGLPSHLPAAGYDRGLLAGSEEPGRPVYVATSRGLAAVLPDRKQVITLGPEGVLDLRYDPVGHLLRAARTPGSAGFYEDTGVLFIAEKPDGGLQADIAGTERTIRRDWVSWTLLAGLPLEIDRWHDGLRTIITAALFRAGSEGTAAHRAGKRVWALRGWQTPYPSLYGTTVVEVGLDDLASRVLRPADLPAPLVSESVTCGGDLWLLCQQGWLAGDYATGAIARVAPESRPRAYTLGTRKLFRPTALCAGGDTVWAAGLGFERGPKTPHGVGMVPEGSTVLLGRLDRSADRFVDVPLRLPAEGPHGFFLRSLQPAGELLLATVLAEGPVSRYGWRELRECLAAIRSATGEVTWLPEPGSPAGIYWQERGVRWTQVGATWWYPAADGIHRLDPATGHCDTIRFPVDYAPDETAGLLAAGGRLYALGSTPDDAGVVKLFRGRPGAWDEGTMLRAMPGQRVARLDAALAATDDGVVWVGLADDEWGEAIPVCRPENLSRRVPPVPTGLMRVREPGIAKLLSYAWPAAGPPQHASFGPLDAEPEPVESPGPLWTCVGQRGVTRLCGAGDGLWIGTRQGLYRLSGDQIAPWGPPFRPDDPAVSIITGLCQAGGRIWMATPKGLRSRRISAGPGVWWAHPEVTFNSQAPFRLKGHAVANRREGLSEARMVFAETAQGLLVAGPCLDGTYLVDLPADPTAPPIRKLSHAPVHVYDAAAWRGRVLLRTAEALYLYDLARDRSEAAGPLQGVPLTGIRCMALDGDAVWLAGQKCLERVDLPRLGWP